MDGNSNELEAVPARTYYVFVRPLGDVEATLIVLTVAPVQSTINDIVSTYSCGPSAVIFIFN